MEQNRTPMLELDPDIDQQFVTDVQRIVNEEMQNTTLPDDREYKHRFEVFDDSPSLPWLHLLVGMVGLVFMVALLIKVVRHFQGKKEDRSSRYEAKDESEMQQNV